MVGITNRTIITTTKRTAVRDLFPPSILANISIKGSTINNIGEFKEIWETGNALYLSYENISTNQFSYILQTGYTKYKENPDHDFKADDATFNMIPVQVGGRYYILVNSIRPFLMAMTGMNIINSKYPIYRITEENEPEIIWDSGTQIRLNFQVGLGLAIKLFSDLQLEIIGNYNSHILDAPIHYNITGLELGVGLNWKLN